ncbi:hypothetical protein [uncultured Sphingomonas sp.]|uniref:hypothetical protein n=1 Tax=uncultured Sphingomonas sp. TaxID=158754 RepID=UPI0035CBAB10
MDRHEEARRLNSDLSLVGLRAQATAVGLVQLCAELLQAGVLDDQAIGRIKTAIADQIVVSYKPKRGREDFEAALLRRLDKLFPLTGQDGHPAAAVGTSQDMRTGLNLEPDHDI